MRRLFSLLSKLFVLWLALKLTANLVYYSDFGYGPHGNTQYAVLTWLFGLTLIFAFRDRVFGSWSLGSKETNLGSIGQPIEDQIEICPPNIQISLSTVEASVVADMLVDYEERKIGDERDRDVAVTARNVHQKLLVELQDA